MVLYKTNGQSSDRIESTLFFTTFFLHCAWTVYAVNAEKFTFIQNLQEALSSLYAINGFEWSGSGAYVVTSALASSFIFNCTRRTFEGVLLGWPRFKKHDSKSLVHAFALLGGYGLMTYFATGFLGEKYSTRPIDFINIALVGVFTYLFGFLVNFVDEVISALYSIIRRGTV